MSTPCSRALFPRFCGFVPTLRFPRTRELSLGSIRRRAFQNLPNFQGYQRQPSSLALKKHRVVNRKSAPVFLLPRTSSLNYLRGRRSFSPLKASTSKFCGPGAAYRSSMTPKAVPESVRFRAFQNTRRYQRQHSPPSSKKLPVFDRRAVPISLFPKTRFSEFSNSTQLPWWVVPFSLLGMWGIVHTEADCQDREARINTLLEKKFELRTTEEKIELFTYLLERGEEVADKAKGENAVIVFGGTGAGKSTLINFLYGCQMAKSKRGKVIVDPHSRIKEVAKIGTQADSCTYVPKRIPDVFIAIEDELPDSEDFGPVIHQHKLTFIDMPGLGDNRGIEVALANVIVMKRIVENANSVRFVMVVEHGLLNSKKGDYWKEAVQLLQETFQGTLGRKKNSLCVVFTKAEESLEAIKEDIQGYFRSKHTSVDLSDYAVVYNPFDPNDRDSLLESIFKARAYKGLGTKISVGKQQLWDALTLGEEVQGGIEKHFFRGNDSEIDAAVKKIQFTHSIAELGNKDLIKPHEQASKAVYDLAPFFGPLVARGSGFCSLISY